MKPGDTFTHDGRRLIAMQQIGAGVDDDQSCAGCIGKGRDHGACRCIDLPDCPNIVFIEDTEEGRAAYAAALLTS